MATNSLGLLANLSTKLIILVTRVANLVKMAVTLIIKEPKTLSNDLLKHTTVQIEEEVESLCAAQDLNDSKRNTLVAEREVSNSTLPCYIPFFWITFC